MKPHRVDVIIFGGGVAGLWLLSKLRAAGRQVVLAETQALGGGQTVASQGILHSGLKYALGMPWSDAAKSLAKVAEVWESHIAGNRTPDLQSLQVLSRQCYLWGTHSWRSRLTLRAARTILRTPPVTVPRGDLPPPLKSCPGAVLRVNETVISPVSLVESLSTPHTNAIISIADGETRFEHASAGGIQRVRLKAESHGETLLLEPRWVVFCAGAGNARLRAQAGLANRSMQLRPLHMVLLRGDLPQLFGHGIDGFGPKVTVTSSPTANGDVVWQVGGDVAERAVDRDPPSAAALARSTLRAQLPDLNLSRTEWATYRVDRAEPRTLRGQLPSDVSLIQEGNVLTAWPVKLVLTPRLVEQAVKVVCGTPAVDGAFPGLAEWPRPRIARPFWETCEWRPSAESDL